MQTYRLAAAAVGATLALASHHAAHAQAAHLTATFTGLGYTLIDLNPGDGIAPSLTWTGGNTTTSLRLSEQVGTDGARYATPRFTNVVNQSTTTPGPLGTPTSLSSGAQAASTGANGMAAQTAIPLGASWRNGATFEGTFTLSPHTAVTFSGQATHHLDVTVPAGTSYVEANGYVNNGYMDWAFMQADAMSGISVYQVGSPVLKAWDQESTWLRTQYTDAKDAAGVVSATFSNDAADAFNGRVAISNFVDGYTVKPLIPEPATWAQLSLGLIAMGAALRLHRRAA